MAGKTAPFRERAIGTVEGEPGMVSPKRLLWREMDLPQARRLARILPRGRREHSLPPKGEMP